MKGELSTDTSSTLGFKPKKQQSMKTLRAHSKKKLNDDDKTNVLRKEVTWL